MAVARGAFALGLLLCVAGLWLLSALEGWGAALCIVPLSLGGGILALALPVALVGARMRRQTRGQTTLLHETALREEDARELFRLVDLVRGRLAGAFEHLDDGACEVWLCSSQHAVRALRRAAAVGVGRVGPAVCPLPDTGHAGPDELLDHLSRSLADNAAAGLGGRLRGFLGDGLAGWLAVCGSVPDGPRRRLALHAEAARLSLARPASPLVVDGPTYATLGARERLVLARSFTGFLVQRYGTRAYLHFLGHADRNAPAIALLLAYSRPPRELEARWRAYLETGAGVAADTSQASA
jgi:hypothetical protein